MELEKMKIGIVTQPLRYNYGGLLQNYALQTILKEMGYDVITIDQDENFPTGIHLLISNIKAFIYKNILHTDRLSVRERINLFFSKGEKLRSFKQKYIECTQSVKNKKETLKLVKKINCNAYIVGSDQVWRPQYNKILDNCFLLFTKKLNVKRIAYAASLGVDKWEFSFFQTRKYKKSISSFDAVSVREFSAIQLCKKYFNIIPEVVLDPTLLLDKTQYIQLIESEEMLWNKEDIFAYLLDDCPQNREILKIIEKKRNAHTHCISISLKGNKEFSSVSEWLSSFLYSNFVVCDSFHGCVFSIIFNKNFIVIGNKERGETRFESLLQMFELQNRMIYSLNDIDKILNTPINWNRVNGILLKNKEKSISFLKKSLKI